MLAPELFVEKPEASAVYAALLRRIAPLGPYEEQVKSTSIHLARRSAFAGIHPRKAAILLVVRTASAIESSRVRKRERVSANRWHNEFLLSSPSEVDDELMAWVAEAYALSGP
jgi:hypothetical protein